MLGSTDAFPINCDPIGLRARKIRRLALALRHSLTLSTDKAAQMNCLNNLFKNVTKTHQFLAPDNPAT